MILLARLALGLPNCGKYQIDGIIAYEGRCIFTLLKWYHNHCNRDWEHGNRIHIDSIDNPGWSITINLEETELENKKIQKLKLKDPMIIGFFVLSKKINLKGAVVLSIYQKYSKSFAIGLKVAQKKHRKKIRRLKTSDIIDVFIE